VAVIKSEGVIGPSLCPAGVVNPVREPAVFLIDESIAGRLIKTFNSPTQNES
jgi:hypothetical protein